MSAVHASSDCDYRHMVQLLCIIKNPAEHCCCHRVMGWHAVIMVEPLPSPLPFMKSYNNQWMWKPLNTKSKGLLYFWQSWPVCPCAGVFSMAPCSSMTKDQPLFLSWAHFPWDHQGHTMLPCRPFDFIICEFREQCQFENSNERQKYETWKDYAENSACQEVDETMILLGPLRKFVTHLLNTDRYLIMRSCYSKASRNL